MANGLRVGRSMQSSWCALAVEQLDLKDSGCTSIGVEVP